MDSLSNSLQTKMVPSTLLGELHPPSSLSLWFTRLSFSLPLSPREWVTFYYCAVVWSSQSPSYIHNSWHAVLESVSSELDTSVFASQSTQRVAPIHGRVLTICHSFTVYFIHFYDHHLYLFSKCSFTLGDFFFLPFFDSLSAMFVEFS